MVCQTLFHNDNKWSLFLSSASLFVYVGTRAGVLSVTIGLLVNGEPPVRAQPEIGMTFTTFVYIFEQDVKDTLRKTKVAIWSPLLITDKSSFPTSCGVPTEA